MSKTDLSIVQLIFSLFIFLFSGFVITFLWRRNQRNHNRLVKFQLFGLGFAGITLTCIFLVPAWAHLYTEILWYKSISYDHIFFSLLHLKWIRLIGKHLLIALVFISSNCLVAHLICPVSNEFGRWTEGRTYRFYRLIATIVILISVVLALPMAFFWDDFLRADNAIQIDDLEPIFQLPKTYFLFQFPKDRITNTWYRCLMWSNILIMALLYHFYYRRDPQTLARIKISLALHTSILWLFLLILSFWGCQLDIWNTLFTSKVPWGLGRLNGFGFIDDKLVKAYRLYRIVLCLFGISILSNLIWRVRWIWYVSAIGWMVSYLVLIQAYPLVSHLIKERRDPHVEIPYLVNHIQATRQAFGLDSMTLRVGDVTGSATLDLIEKHPEVKNNIQIWDRRVLYEVLTGHPQRLMPYFQFHPYTDVDRYRINGNLRQVLVAAREIDVESLPEEAQDWVHRKLIYTHGYGVCVVPVNEFQQQDPVFWVKGEKRVGDEWRLVSQNDFPTITQPQIYYGELTQEYVIVGTNREEVDLENHEYQGEGGISLNNWIRRFAFAVRFDFWRIILSTDINSEESRIMFRRKIGTRKATSLEIVADRVSHVAPFFRCDPDPYIVVGDDGQLWWIVDLYLTSDHYPNSKTYIDQTTLMETYSEPKFDRYNYIRNPAVAVINAYSGKINFYFTKETTEPISLSYEKAFATDDGRSLFKPLQEMPAGLQNHLRYPDYLTRVQAEIYKDYHVLDSHPKNYSTIFFQASDKWDIPKEKYGEDNSYKSMMPYYATVSLPSSHSNSGLVEFVNIIPFTPPERVRYMNAVMVARCDDEFYGQLVLYNLPKDQTILGPTLAEATIDTELSQDLTLWNQQGTVVIRGNLLVIPVENTLFYIEPIYLKPEGVEYPDLEVITVQAGGQFASASDFDGALREIYGIGVSAINKEQIQKKTNGNSEAATLSLEHLIQSASKNYNQYLELTGDGNLSKAAEAFETLGQNLKSLVKKEYINPPPIEQTQNNQ